MTTQEFLLDQDYEERVNDANQYVEDECDYITLKESIIVSRPIIIQSLIEKYSCAGTLTVDAKRNATGTMKIQNEEVLNYLRDLWIQSSSKFVKGVIKTVGINQEYSFKQMRIICNEAVKFNVELRFLN